jgi:hypothetical protein
MRKAVRSAERPRIKSVAVCRAIGSSPPGGAATAARVSYRLESVEKRLMLTLSEAIKTKRLAEFIDQEEARGVGAADLAQLDRALAKVIKSRRSEDQTSRSASRGGSTGKQTRPDKKPYASR